MIPENLRIMPTDSEEEKVRKRKKVKHLKSAVRRKEEEEEEKETAKSWKDFISKVSPTQARRCLAWSGPCGVLKSLACRLLAEWEEAQGVRGAEEGQGEHLRLASYGRWQGEQVVTRDFSRGEKAMSRQTLS